MATEIWVNIGSDNGLLPVGTKPTSWTNVHWSSVKSNYIHISAISQKIPQPAITKICWKITYLKFHSNFPRANELIWCDLMWCNLMWFYTTVFFYFRAVQAQFRCFNGCNPKESVLSSQVYKRLVKLLDNLKRNYNKCLDVHPWNIAKR